MNRNTLMLFGGALVLLIVVLILAIFLRGAREEQQVNNVTDPFGEVSSPTGSQTIGPITVYDAVGGWKKVENTSENFSANLPENWDVSADTGNYSIKASTIAGSEGIVFDVYTFDNPQSISPAAWAKNERGVTQSTPVEVGGIAGIRYVGKIVYGGGDFPYGSDEFEDSYLASIILGTGGKIIEVGCAVSGPGYESYKSTCEEILNSFTL